MTNKVDGGGVENLILQLAHDTSFDQIRDDKVLASIDIHSWDNLGRARVGKIRGKKDRPNTNRELIEQVISDHIGLSHYPRFVSEWINYAHPTMLLKNVPGFIWDNKEPLKDENDEIAFPNDYKRYITNLKPIRGKTTRPIYLRKKGQSLLNVYIWLFNSNKKYLTIDESTEEIHRRRRDVVEYIQKIKELDDGKYKGISDYLLEKLSMYIDRRVIHHE